MLRTSGSEALVKYIVQCIYALFIGNNIYNEKNLLYSDREYNVEQDGSATVLYNCLKGNIFKVLY
jgi:hypothetical protein